MRSNDCTELYHNRELKNYIWGKAHGRAHSMEEAEDYFQEAWLKIWMNIRPDESIEYYKNVAKKGINAAYMRKYRRNAFT